MSKTIRELSEELGVSKTAITKFLTPEKRNLFAKKIDNQNENQVGEIENLVFDFNDELFLTLKNELAEKNKQIEKLQKNIEQQNILIDQQQKLTLQANQKIESLEANLKILESKDQKKETVTSKKDEPITNKKSKKHWWQF